MKRNALLPPDGGSYTVEHGQLVLDKQSITRAHPGKSQLAREALAIKPAAIAPADSIPPAAPVKPKR